MKRKYIILFFVTPILFFLLQACSDTLVVDYSEDVVVQAYLYENEPINEIKLMLSNPINSEEESNTLLTEADIKLIKDGKYYTLKPITSRSGFFYYPGNDLNVNAGDVFDLNVNYNNKNITASTQIPIKPEALNINQNSITFEKDTISSPWGGGSMERIITNDSIVIKWKNDLKDNYYVVVECVELEKTKIRTDTFRTFKMIYQPTQDDKYKVNMNSINYYGKHKITLYHINQEYVNLFRSSYQDSRSLNEPITNVKNGLGIFTAFSSDSVFFTTQSQ